LSESYLVIYRLRAAPRSRGKFCDGSASNRRLYL